MGWLLEKPNETKLEKKIKDFVAYYQPPYWLVFIIGFSLGCIIFYFL
jgi:hypothetical protein